MGAGLPEPASRGALPASWLCGWLSVWRKDDVRWLAYVTFSHLDGVTQPRWFDQDDVKPLPVARR